MPDFSAYDWRELAENPFGMIAEGWMLVTAGEPGSWNTMTASWGGLGHLWNKDVVFVFVRPTRHTFGFMEKSEGFTLSYFGPEHRRALEICGSISGRDRDKAQAAGISPRTFLPPGGQAGGGPGRVAFEEARLVLSCRKIHAQDLDPSCFIDPSIAANYKARDWHRVYIGAVEAAWKRAG
jgi:flavin reductase (DIM6/NTAB) family NADH-FMN oxidoreductase RutF